MKIIISDFPNNKWYDAQFLLLNLNKRSQNKQSILLTFVCFLNNTSEILIIVRINLFTILSN